MTRRTWHNCQPEDLHSLARQWFVRARRIELQKLAAELGISRATAYRWAGSAEQLVGKVLASLVDDMYRNLAHRIQTVGRDRVLDVLENSLLMSFRFAPLRKFLAREPQAALRIAASDHGPVRARTVANLQRILEAEVASGELVLPDTPEAPATPAAVAYALTRVLESFLYTDLATDGRPDVANARHVFGLVLGPTPK